MRRTARLVFFGWLLVVATVAFARPHAETKLHVFGRSPGLAIRLGDGGAFFFEGEPVRIAVQFYWGYADNGSHVASIDKQPFQLVSDWPDAVRWRVVDENGHEAVSPTALRVIGTQLHGYPFTNVFEAMKSGKTLAVKDLREIRSGDIVTATIEVPPLPPGRYHVQAEVRGRETSNASRTGLAAAVPLAILRGTENPEVRREYLRWQINERTAIRNYKLADVKPLLDELVSLSPSDFLVYDRYGDISLGRVSPDQTLAYYRQADALLAKTLKGKRIDGHARKFFVRKQDKFAAFEKIYPYYAERARNATIEVVETTGVVEFVVRDRASGKVLRATR